MTKAAICRPAPVSLSIPMMVATAWVRAKCAVLATEVDDSCRHRAPFDQELSDGYGKLEAAGPRASGVDVQDTVALLDQWLM